MDNVDAQPRWRVVSSCEKFGILHCRQRSNNCNCKNEFGQRKSLKFIPFGLNAIDWNHFARIVLWIEVFALWIILFHVLAIARKEAFSGKPPLRAYRSDD